MIIDFHSHILPSIDDGSRNIAESIEMLLFMGRQGVDCLIATPHFYPDRISINDFLKKREKACYEIGAQGLAGVPTVKCGTEVAFFKGIGKSELLNALCIDRTNLMLLEMPFREWTIQDLEDIQRIMDKGIVPILAHVERYECFQRNKPAFREIMRLPLHFQINAGAFASFRMRRSAFRIIASKKAILLGSDCHNMHDRYPNLSVGRNVLLDKYGLQFLAEMDALGTALLSSNSNFKERDK